MSSEQNKIILRRIMSEIISRADYAAADELIAPDLVSHPLRVGQTQGVEGFKRGLHVLRAGFPDWQSVPEQLIGEGDIVAARWIVRGTHTGSFMGVPATGIRVSMREMGFFRFARGKLVEFETLADEIALLRQLGVLPPPPAPTED